MANHTNQQNTVIATDETFNLGGILNQALIEILITRASCKMSKLNSKDAARLLG